jgi:hypothetical protein
VIRTGRLSLAGHVAAVGRGHNQPLLWTGPRREYRLFNSGDCRRVALAATDCHPLCPCRQPGNLVVDYASIDVDDGIPFMRPMWRWRSVCATCFCATIAGLFIWLPIALGAFLATVITGILTLVYLERAARTEVNLAYSMRHLMLAILLCPVFFLGVWLVPVLVHSDLIKWRRVEERNRARA